MSIKILALMLAMVPPHYHKYHKEDPADVKKRYAVIANAISAEAGTDVTLALYLLTTARHESGLNRKVHAGTKRGDQGRSWGLYQIMCGRHPKNRVPLTKFQCKDIVGVDKEATARATQAASIHLKKHIKYCKGRVRCVFASYMGAYGKYSKRVRKLVLAREWTFRKLRNKWLKKKKKK